MNCVTTSVQSDGFRPGGVRRSYTSAMSRQVQGWGKGFCKAPPACQAAECRCGLHSMRRVTCSSAGNTLPQYQRGDDVMGSHHHQHLCLRKHERQRMYGMQTALGTASSHRRMKLPVAMFQSWGSCAALVPSSTCHKKLVSALSASYMVPPHHIRCVRWVSTRH